MAWTLAQLKTADAALVGAPLALDVATAQLNAQTTTSPAVDLAWSAIRDVMMNNFDWGTLVACCNTAVGMANPGGGTQTAAIRNAAVAIRDCCIYGGMFASSNATVWSRLTAAANLLIPSTVGAITSASASAVVALRAPTVPTWAPPLNTGDVQTARAQP